MNLAVGLLGGMVIVWGILTGVLTLLLIYRSVVGLHVEDQLFLGATEEHKAQEQKKVARSVDKVGPFVYALGTISAVLLLVILGIWLWVGLRTPQ
jgi:hypothetical protein